MTWKICNPVSWQQFISPINMYSFYNLLEYSRIFQEENWKILYLLNFKDNIAVSGCKLYIKKKFKINIIYIPGGIEGEINIEVIDSLAKFLKKNFGYFFISLIDLHQNNKTHFKSKIWKNLKKNNYKTIYKKFDKSESNLHNTYSKNFRHNVKRSLKYNLKTRINNSPNIKEIYNLYLNMKNFKKLLGKITYDKLKSKIITLDKNCICFETRKDNNLLSFRAIIISNNMAWDYIAFTTFNGRKNYASYQLINYIFEYCKNNNIKYYDLGGIDKLRNRGVYNFKIGTGGDIFHRLGHFCYAPLFFIKYLFTIFYTLKY